MDDYSGPGTGRFFFCLETSKKPSFLFIYNRSILELSTIFYLTLCLPYVGFSYLFWNHH